MSPYTLMPVLRLYRYRDKQCRQPANLQKGADGMGVLPLRAPAHPIGGIGGVQLIGMHVVNA